MADRLLLLLGAPRSRYGPALGRSAAAVRAASTSTTGNDTTGTSTSKEASQKPRRYRLTVDSVAVRLRPSWGPIAYRYPLPGPSGWGTGPLSLLDRSPGWLLELSRWPARPGWLLERLILSGVITPRTAEERKVREGPSNATQQEHEPEETASPGRAQCAEEERRADAATGAGSHTQNPTAEGPHAVPDTGSEPESPKSDSDSESRVADDSESGAGRPFRMETDVRGFSADEVKVTVAEGAVTVEAERDRETDSGRLRRHLYRRVQLPPGVLESQVTVTRTDRDTVLAEAPLGG